VDGGTEEEMGKFVVDRAAEDDCGNGGAAGGGCLYSSAPVPSHPSATTTAPSADRVSYSSSSRTCPPRKTVLVSSSSMTPLHTSTSLTATF